MQTLLEAFLQNAEGLLGQGLKRGLLCPVHLGIGESHSVLRNMVASPGSFSMR